MPEWNSSAGSGRFSGFNFLVKQFSSSGSGFSGFGYSGSGNYAVPKGFSQKDISPYYQKVKISSFGYSGSGSRSQIQLYSYTAPGEKINITGWRLKSRSSDVYVPRAVNIYDPSGLASEEDIVLSGNSAVSIYGMPSPIAKNLRVNKCLGYLQQSNSFDHRGDSDFLSNTWLVYGVPFSTHRYADTIYLYDKQGLLVDLYGY
ncbi:hypothetical protein HY227_00860 [Candidatus Wolfebacteria bacterium]|nr:hypothetical protein [Candidatus Wolfebacteria bacterium]